MSRSIALVGIILSMSVAVPHAQAIRYVVEPVALSGGYAISGGFIETDTSGPLMDGDITDYQVTVDGDLPHIFSPSNPGGSVEISGSVLATNGQLVIPSVPDLGEVTYLLEFSSVRGQDTAGLSGSRYLTFVSGFPEGPWGPYSVIRYGADEGPFEYGLARRLVFPDTIPAAKPLVVATVPEPSAVTLIFLGVCVAGTRMKRKA